MGAVCQLLFHLLVHFAKLYGQVLVLQASCSFGVPPVVPFCWIKHSTQSLASIWKQDYKLNLLVSCQPFAFNCQLLYKSRHWPTLLRIPSGRKKWSSLFACAWAKSLRGIEYRFVYLWPGFKESLFSLSVNPKVLYCPLKYNWHFLCTITKQTGRLA